MLTYDVLGHGQVRGEGAPRPSSCLRFLNIRPRSSFADRSLLGAVGQVRIVMTDMAAVLMLT
jgi:hypothetical protein